MAKLTRASRTPGSLGDARLHRPRAVAAIHPRHIECPHGLRCWGRRLHGGNAIAERGDPAREYLGRDLCRVIGHIRRAAHEVDRRICHTGSVRSDCSTVRAQSPQSIPVTRKRQETVAVVAAFMRSAPPLGAPTICRGGRCAPRRWRAGRAHGRHPARTQTVCPRAAPARDRARARAATDARRQTASYRAPPRGRRRRAPRRPAR